MATLGNSERPSQAFSDEEASNYSWAAFSLGPAAVCRTTSKHTLILGKLTVRGTRQVSYQGVTSLPALP